MDGLLKVLKMKRFNGKIEHLKYFENLLVIDPQEDCDCDIEIYDAGCQSKCIWLNNGTPEIVDCYDRINLPMCYDKITFNQFKECFLTGIKFAKEISTARDIFEYDKIIINPISSFDSLSNEYKDNLVSFLHHEYRVIYMSEIPENKIYFAPPPEMLGVFTWNLSKYGMFIMANNFGMQTI